MEAIKIEIDYKRLAECIVEAMHKPEPYLTIEEVSERLQKPVSRIYRYTSTNVIPFHKIGRSVRFLWSEVSSWAASEAGQ